MNIDELTLGQIKEIQNMVGCTPNQRPVANFGFYIPGKAYFIRTVTHHFTGELIGFDRGGRELIMKKCAWIASDGRFTQAIVSGTLDEVEPYPTDAIVNINRETIIDAVEWTHPIPESQK